MNQKMTDLLWQDQTVWLIGASTGIGLATAKALYLKGAKVVVSARKEKALNEFVMTHPTDENKHLHQPQAIALDVLDLAAVHQASLQISQSIGLDRVVFCAGIYEPLRVSNWQLSIMKQHVEVNYVGLLNVLDAVLPIWLNTNNSQVNGDHSVVKKVNPHLSIISSVAGYIGLPNSMAYGPTKAALINLAETLYLDLKSFNIDVSLINPGFVETPLTAQNQFKMPALITSEKAAQFILQGWQNGSFEIHFPKRFTMWLKLLKTLPYTLQFWAVKKFTGV